MTLRLEEQLKQTERQAKSVGLYVDCNNEFVLTIMNYDNEEMIDVEPTCRLFKQYFEIDNRCILSAKFGDGKSYFLSKFTQMFNDEYLFITIYPVNYQVMENGEIFELIKRDILLRLLSEEAIISKKIEYTNSFQAAYYLSQNYEEVFGNLMQIIPQFNFCGLEIDLGNICKGLKSIISGYKEWEKKIKETDKEKSEKFIKDFNVQQGSIYEFDAISQLIYNIILDYKGSSGKKVALIIEDLDRIDPAHIFRILNVFSAHFDNKSYGEGNKYNFDKIITVCDYDNIKNIYHHVYGEKTDFIGYISKFSSREPFYYSIYKLLKEYILNNLLDEKLLKYKGICNVLCDNIIRSLNKKTDFYNLRIVKQRLIKAKEAILNKNIKLDKDLKDYYISSSNTLAYLVAITKSFNIDEKTMLNNNQYNEIIEMIGSGWLILSIFESKIIYEIYNRPTKREITITINKELAPNTFESYKAGKIEILSCKNNIIDDIKLSIDKGMEKILQDFLFGKKNEVFDYYRQNIVL